MLRTLIFILFMTTGAASACNSTLFTLVSWKLEPIEAQHMALTAVFRSNSSRTILEIVAEAGFVGADGVEIGRYELFPMITFEPNAEREDRSVFGPDTFVKVLAEAKPEEVTTFLCVKSVTYDDFDQERFP